MCAGLFLFWRELSLELDIWRIFFGIEELVLGSLVGLRLFLGLHLDLLINLNKLYF